MKDIFSGEFRRSVLKQQQDAEGRWLCECGALPQDDELWCAECRAAHARKREADERDRHLAAWRSGIEACAALPGVPAWPNARNQIKGDLLLAAADIYAIQDGSLLLLGPSGCGKTSAAVAILQRLAGAEVARVLALGLSAAPSPLLRALRGVVWATGQQLAKARRQTRMGAGEAPVVEQACAAPILVVDELGFETKVDDVAFEILDTRYAANRPTIVTSGRRSAGFQARYGHALWRRITERGSVVSEWSEAEDAIDDTRDEAK